MSLTQEDVTRLLDYDAPSGVFRWRASNKGHATGETAGTAHGNGYVRVTVNGQRIFAHRLAWLYVHGVDPAGDIDHINGRRDDNRICNLRHASRRQNLGNTPRPKANTSGFKGVSRHSSSGRWRATIKVEKRQVHLGYFDNPEDAHAAYKVAALKHFGEFARL